MPPRRARFAAEPDAIIAAPDAQPNAAAQDTTGDAEFAARLHQQEVAAHVVRQQQHVANRRAAMDEAIQARQAQAEAAEAVIRAINLDQMPAGGLAVGPGGAARFGILPVARPAGARVDNDNALRNAARFMQLADGNRYAAYGPLPFLPGMLPPWERYANLMEGPAGQDAALERAIARLGQGIYGHAAMQAERQQSVEESWSGINFTPRHNPLLGFTYDFDKDAEDDKEPTEIVRLDFDDESPIIEELKAPVAGSSKHLGRHDSMSSVDGKGKAITSLVCAKCNEQLRVSQGQRNEADRVYALRCGHLIDKRCLDDISQPHPDPGLNIDEDAKPGFVKMGKGKAVESSSRNGGTFVVKGSYPVSATTPRASSSTLPRIVSPNADQQSSSPSVPLNNSEADGSNQGRPSRTTRSTARAAAVHPDHENDIPDSDDEGYDTLTNPNGRLPKGRKRKFTSKVASKSRTAAMKKLAGPVEMREFRWVCPVAACGKEHFSEEIGGVWKPKDGMTVQLNTAINLVE
ncbi:hypothetical protein QFC22_002060 [Naganishia vaughanmartiniae]|uniref:Uncharacterized protein n=1 Tax=Naganishia vaughanmartiniae TaxID=1424756 RepID=A0ACC2XG65_9TREE|nr:hypothetical protein QFC22_002060 [Naganishia vaughanmartiniae]